MSAVKYITKRAREVVVECNVHPAGNFEKQFRFTLPAPHRKELSLDVMNSANEISAYIAAPLSKYVPYALPSETSSYD